MRIGLATNSRLQCPKYFPGCLSPANDTLFWLVKTCTLREHLSCGIFEANLGGAPCMQKRLVVQKLWYLRLTCFMLRWIKNLGCWIWCSRCSVQWSRMNIWCWYSCTVLLLPWSKNWLILLHFHLDMTSQVICLPSYPFISPGAWDLYRKTLSITFSGCLVYLPLSWTGR